MRNPFVIDGCLSYKASVNRTVMIDIAAFTDEISIEGKTAVDIFSPAAIIAEMKKHAAALHLEEKVISENEFPVYLNQCLESKDKELRSIAESIAKKFGERLGFILCKLRRGKADSPLERTDWTDEGFEFWQHIETVILSGGLSSGKMGAIFQQQILLVFERVGLKPYKIILNQHAANAGITGAASFIKEKYSVNLVFDFGQSFLKRCAVYLRDGEVKSIVRFTKWPSKFMEWSADESVLQEKEGLLLDEYLQDAIVDAYRESVKQGIIVADEIAISLANYICKGKVQHRGGYGKLKFISDNYEEHLSKSISLKTEKNFRFRIIHDGTAIAAAFKNIPDAVSFALGTSFGVGFPEKQIL